MKIKSITYVLHQLSEFKAVLTLEDRNQISVRPITNAFFKNLGDKIELFQNNPSNYKAVSYGISFKKIIYNLEDKSQGCVTYPTSAFQSYWNCDYNFINKYLRNAFKNLFKHSTVQQQATTFPDLCAAAAESARSCA